MHEVTLLTKAALLHKQVSSLELQLPVSAFSRHDMAQFGNCRFMRPGPEMRAADAVARAPTKAVRTNVKRIFVSVCV